MKEKTIQLLTGLAFYAAMVLIGFSTIFQARSYGLDKGIHLPVVLESAEGLRVGAQVLVLGIPKGVVSSLHYVLIRPDGGIVPWDEEQKPIPGTVSVGQKVLCVLDLEQDITLYPNYKITTRYPSPIAQKIVAIEPGRKGEAPAPAAGTLRPDDPAAETVWQPLKLNRQELLDFQKSGLLPERGRLLASQNSDDPIYLAASIIADNRDTLHRIIANLAQITDKLNRGQGTTAALLNRDALSSQTNDILAGVIILLNEARYGVEDTRESRAMTDFIAALLPVIFKAAGL